MGVKRNTYKIWVRKPEGRNLFGTFVHSWDNNTKIDHEQIGRKAVHWIHQAQDGDQWKTLVNPIMNLWFP
jgi:hypothetical protein